MARVIKDQLKDGMIVVMKNGQLFHYYADFFYPIADMSGDGVRELEDYDELLKHCTYEHLDVSRVFSIRMKTCTAENLANNTRLLLGLEGQQVQGVWYECREDQQESDNTILSVEFFEKHIENCIKIGDWEGLNALSNFMKTSLKAGEK